MQENQDSEYRSQNKLKTFDRDEQDIQDKQQDRYRVKSKAFILLIGNSR